MKMSKALFKRMVDLFVAPAADPIWNDGEPWYCAGLIAPYTPGPDFEDLLPGEYMPPATGNGYSTSLPAAFIIGYEPGTENLTCSAVADDPKDNEWPVTDAALVGLTVYGYYVYYSNVLDESWAATVPLATPIGPLSLGDIIRYPPIQFTFNPDLQV